MPGKASVPLVIDASVARASGGEDATYPTSKHCRDFLKAVLSICHRIVMTPPIAEEWSRHQSRFARQWRVSMNARKKVVRIEGAENDDLRSKIGHIGMDRRDCDAMLKDLPLIETALVAGQTVISLDQDARIRFDRAAQSAGDLKTVVWVNPDKIREEEPLLWLQNGAKPERRRRLGSGSE